MKDTSNNSLLSLKNGYGTFPESSATIALQKSLSSAKLECGKKWYRNSISGCTISFPTTLVVKNDGSTARDNCSIERNFLAWLRLSVALVFIGISYYFRFEIISPAFPSENEKDQYSYPTLLERCITVQHESIHFSVAAFVGMAISIACIFNIMQEEG
ncbi:hypothetical protein RclHR1_24470002 [Rhizophagus clarus]|uniref:PF02656 domain protein n=1 Tax=Rhizophagus clarus TaxID=94130 RepID=A0A2Z6RAP0_9GLOM|nr:hypothetical protein RclHR1_24470002 [Rhizophagus clarus]GET01421.1 PF02656 domain protein [Rhizophagus clarus]